MTRRPCAAASLLCATFALVSAGSTGRTMVTAAQDSIPACPADAMTIRAARLLDGRGGTSGSVVVAVRGNTIESVGDCRGTVTHDLGDLTVLPGLIDVHVHLDWHFEPDGRFAGPGASTASDEQRSAAILQNGRLTLEAGFTTVQSLGSGVDLALRDAIARGAPGPRILTSVGQIVPDTRTPDELRATVRAVREVGADVIKVIAPDGLTGADSRRRAEAQLTATCAEARSLGLRTVVHAQDSAAILAAVGGRCGQVEHGTLADDAALRAMAGAGVYFVPNIGLNVQNYLAHRDAFGAAPGYTPERFRLLSSILPTLGPLFRRALDVRVRMPLGSDAVAGAHGSNAREIIARVRDGGQRGSDAIVSATSLAAESLGLGDRIGTLAAGFEADVIAVRGDPLRDVRALEQVVFVVQGGRVRKAP